jgi:cell division initiation protein
MKLTPIDIQQQEFGRRLRGYDRKEVENFLDLVAAQMGELSRDNSQMRSEISHLKREIEEHRDREETLREAMLTAQRAIDEIRDTAKKEAELVVTEAEMRAEKILHSAHGRVTKLIDEINELKRQRTRAIEEVRSVLSTHAKLLDMYEQAGQADADEEGTVTVLDRVRAPTPPVADDLVRSEVSG